MYHAMAWGLPYACAFAGADIVLPGTDTSPETLSNLIQSERVTVAAAVPTVWANVYHELQRNPRDISSLRAIITGGSAPPVWLIEAYEKELGVEVIHAWGMTEMSPTGTVSRLQTRHKYLTQQAQWKLKAKQGTPVPGVALRVVEASGREVPRDGTTMGEVQVRGMSVVGEYEKEDNDNNTFTPDGWLRTGDVATIDADGYMQLTDRAKDLIKSGGEWVSSVALENALTSHANVSEAAVIAVADETWGERPVALVVPIQANDPPTQDELLAHMAPGFPKFWLPNKIILVDALPKTSVGKLDKQALRKRYG